MKLALFIPSLEVGGAERQMILLAKSLMENGHDVSLWCLRETGAFVAETKDYGIPVFNVGKGGRYDLLGAAIRLRRIYQQAAPDVIVSCLPSANLYALFVRLLRPKIIGKQPRLIWGLASAKLPVGEYGWWAKISYWVQAKSARWVDKVVVNSVAGWESARQEGYPVNKLQVIHNGVDMQRFMANSQDGEKWRKEMNIPTEAALVGMAGRLDPAKNYEVFLQACEIVAVNDDRVWFVIVGGGDNEYATELKAKIDNHPLYGHRLRYKSNETNMPAMYSALNLMTLTSKSEGLPNTVVEAMACETPCVVTDVGDCRLAVDRFGVVCEVGDAQGIAESWLSIISSKKSNEAANSGARKNKIWDFSGLRKYMDQTFSLEKMTKQFEDACTEVQQQGKRGG
ncbi:MAG: glycosyltransferase [Gammaproteobacteria bacterium]|nr:glycosyltransferase [Gammaproteobacteria bacterium]